MLFLLNDVVLTLEPSRTVPPMEARRFRALTLASVLKLGSEMFAEAPLLHREDPECARRLATLIASKNPEVNAALFAAPRRGCPTDQVVARLAQVSLDVMGALRARFDDGALTPVAADREVWRRMAA